MYVVEVCWSRALLLRHQSPNSREMEKCLMEHGRLRKNDGRKKHAQGRAKGGTVGSRGQRAGPLRTDDRRNLVLERTGLSPANTFREDGSEKPRDGDRIALPEILRILRKPIQPLHST